MNKSNKGNITLRRDYLSSMKEIVPSYTYTKYGVIITIDMTDIDTPEYLEDILGHFELNTIEENKTCMVKFCIPKDERYREVEDVINKLVKDNVFCFRQINITFNSNVIFSKCIIDEVD